MTTTDISRHAPPTRAPGVADRGGAARDAAWLVGAAGVAGAIVTLGLWLRHGGLGAASGPGGGATAAGQLAALLGTYAILVQLMLMSRISWLERAIGLDRLAVWHRWNGFAALWLIVAHVVFTTVGWARSAIPSVGVLHETGWLVTHEADILMAWVGFALLVAVAVTSARIAREKMRRETWYFVHLYAYLAIALSFAHQLAVGSDFDGDRAARAWWIALYAIVGASILWWRVIEPIRFNRRHALRVHNVKAEAPGVVSIHLTGRELDRVGALPGQFFMWRLLTPRDWWKPHPFSLSAAPSGEGLRITVKDLGDGTARLQHVRPGTRVFAEGPFGTFTADRATQRRVLLIAGGIGITPLRALLDAFGPDDDVVLLYRVARPEDTIFAEELRRFYEQGRRIYVIPGAEIGDDHTDLLSLPNLARGVPDIRTRDCFVCGPPAFIDALGSRLRKLGVPRSQIHYDRFEL